MEMLKSKESCIKHIPDTILESFRYSKLPSEAIAIRLQRTTNNKKIPYSGMWRRVGLVRTDVSEERVASIFRVEDGD
jgi:hypothetical protein